MDAFLRYFPICLILAAATGAHAEEPGEHARPASDSRPIPSRDTALLSTAGRRGSSAPAQLAQASLLQEGDDTRYLQLASTSVAARSTQFGSSDTCKPEFAGKGTRPRATCRDPLGEDVYGPTLIIVPPGPGHDAFAISKYETSVAEYNAYCNLSDECDEIEIDSALPVTDADFENARAFADWLSKTTGKQYRLPNKSEWEYAATADGHPAKNDVNCETVISGRRIKGLELLEVKAGSQNNWGLKGYIGNAREWVLADTGDPWALLAIGGCYSDPFAECDVSLALPHSGEADELTGFRLIRKLSGASGQ